ncbi:sugar transferase [Psychrobium sp. 1_MG-2023]|uniref:sugar transferase n=1 Tax=Psychrobium sp. 1_MG-2023 TaxID=3062624 RepID=UPI000C34D6C4|nr:sugar transferase [Psychrobium sp. 1_MG-2023]MDP2561334.1 sugar transferase [Psychrobium sp. 1_MG-2023]PKF54148.1 sugar transferase [Alteromonadales bacterium alter-6D02]
MIEQAINPKIKFCKRIIDIVVSVAILIIFAPVMAIVALMVWRDSPGPVIFSQQRIGLSTKHSTQLFNMYKFRTMVADAEKQSGAVWATKGDSRVTKIGRFLRNTRLDELPQLVNVLRGDMSLIGPRPERPGFYQRLETQIPYFAERTFLVQPGITGLAQVNQGYDTCIDDVRTKVGYDHSYALSLNYPLQWLAMDLYIAAKTIVVMVTGRGQ